MKSRIIVMVVAFWGMTAIWAQDSTPWYMGTWNRHQPNPKAKDMPLVQIDGNHFVTPDGNTILFRGIAISDPDKVARQGHWNKEHFARVKALGANIVRIPHTSYSVARAYSSGLSGDAGRSGGLVYGLENVCDA